MFRHPQEHAGVSANLRKNFLNSVIIGMPMHFLLYLAALCVVNGQSAKDDVSALWIQVPLCRTFFCAGFVVNLGPCDSMMKAALALVLLVM